MECPAGTYMPWGIDQDVANVATGQMVTTHSIAGAGTPAKRQFECLDCPGGYVDKYQLSVLFQSCYKIYEKVN